MNVLELPDYPITSHLPIPRVFDIMKEQGATHFRVLRNEDALAFYRVAPIDPSQYGCCMVVMPLELEYAIADSWLLAGPTLPADAIPITTIIQDKKGI